MTNEEAKEHLKDILADVPNDKCIDWIEALNQAIKALEQARPKGKWIIRPDRASDIEYRCSECGKIQFADDTNELNYCCNCGSKMEVEE